MNPGVEIRFCSQAFCGRGLVATEIISLIFGAAKMGAQQRKAGAVGLGRSFFRTVVRNIMMAPLNVSGHGLRLVQI